MVFYINSISKYFSQLSMIKKQAIKYIKLVLRIDRLIFDF